MNHKRLPTVGILIFDDVEVLDFSGPFEVGCAHYAVHKERPFYGDLVKYMMSGPVYVAALERDNAVPELRKLMGATDPKNADAGTIRAEYGESIEQNAIHGSDSDDNAKIEIAFFFAESDLS